MATSTDIKKRALELAAKTDINSINPQEVGGLFYDLTGYGEEVQRNGGTLGIRKVYASVSAMEADSTSPVDMWGNPMRKGNLCVIYDGTQEGSDNNKVFAFKDPGWEIATHLDAGYATRSELVTLDDNVGISEYPVFSVDQDYKAGDVVNYEGKLYEFTADHAKGAWIGTDAEETSVKKDTDKKVTELGVKYVSTTPSATFTLNSIKFNGNLYIKLANEKNVRIIKPLEGKYEFTSASYLVYNIKDNSISIIEGGENIKSSSIILLNFDGTEFVGGWLYSNYIYSFVKNNIQFINCTNKPTFTNKSIYFNSDIYIKYNISESIKTVSVSGISFVFDKSDSEYVGQYLVYNIIDNEVRVVLSGDISLYDIVLLSYFNNSFVGGHLFKYKLSEPYNKKIENILEYGAIDANGNISSYYWGDRCKRTIKFISVHANSSVSFLSEKTCYIQTCYYDKEYNFLKRTSLELANENEEKEIPITADSEFIKINVVMSEAMDFQVPFFKTYLIGNFQDRYEYFNIRPKDDGYQPITLPVNIANVNSANDVATNIQDREELLEDNGLLALPETYSNTGKPTRLIIYCHGAGNHFTNGQTRFEEDDGVNPEYWLKMGYAVLDMDGNPFDKSIPHWFIPQALQSYINAYNFVVRAYNICRDGVFVGGRSMGGGMVLSIINSCIPVIASFMISPTCNFSHWIGAANLNGRKSVADNYGLIGTQPTWTSNSPLTTEEWDFYKNNYKLLARYMPMWSVIIDFPNSENMMNSNFNVDYTTNELEEESELYSILHSKIKVPIKIFIATSDTVAPWKRNANYLYEMLCNGANICELRKFEDGGHYPEFDPNNQKETSLLTGETIIASVPYIEALQFCRRYE